MLTKAEKKLVRDSTKFTHSKHRKTVYHKYTCDKCKHTVIYPITKCIYECKGAIIIDMVKTQMSANRML